MTRSEGEDASRPDCAAGADSAVPDYLASLRLDRQTVLVLGAGAGIGRQVAHAVAQAGAHVVCADRDSAAAAQAAHEVHGTALMVDVTRAGDVQRAIDQAASGPIPLGGIVDIVGEAMTGPLEDTTDEVFERQFDTVLRHAFDAMRAAVNPLQASGGGAMVFVGSMSGIAYAPGQSVYGAAKAALHHLVAAGGREFASRGIRVNAVAPGLTRTPRLVQRFADPVWQAAGRHIPRGHPGRPSEIAGPVLFLLSDLASYITGQVLVVDGAISGNVPDLFAGV